LFIVNTINAFGLSIFLTDVAADGSGGRVVDDVRKFHASHVSFQLQPNRYHCKFYSLAIL